MKITTSVELTDDDYKLLNKKYPENPCIDCCLRQVCTGCDKKKEYNKSILPLSDAGLLDIYIEVERMRKDTKAIKKAQLMVFQASKKLSDIGVDMDKIEV